MVGQLQALVDSATSVTDLQQAIVQAYGNLESDELVKLMAAAMALAELKGLDDVQAERGGVVPGQLSTTLFAEPSVSSATSVEIAAGITAISAAVTLIANRPEPQPAPAPIIHVAPATVQFAEAPAPVIQVDVHNAIHVPEQAAPPVHVVNNVQPAPVTVNNTHPARAVQTVERDGNDEITKTVTTYESNAQPSRNKP